MLLLVILQNNKNCTLHVLKKLETVFGEAVLSADDRFECRLELLTILTEAFGVFSAASTHIKDSTVKHEVRHDCFLLLPL